MHAGTIGRWRRGADASPDIAVMSIETEVHTEHIAVRNILRSRWRAQLAPFILLVAAGGRTPRIVSLHVVPDGAPDGGQVQAGIHGDRTCRDMAILAWAQKIIPPSRLSPAQLRFVSNDHISGIFCIRGGAPGLQHYFSI
jgi:hypothetical protein